MPAIQHWGYVSWNITVTSLTTILRIIKFALADSPRNRLLKLGMAGGRCLLSLAYLIYALHNPINAVISFSPWLLLAGAICSFLSSVGVYIGFKVLAWLEKRFNIGRPSDSTAREYGFNSNFNQTMVYLTQAQRTKLRDLAVIQMKGSISREFRWYSPTHRLKDHKRNPPSGNIIGSKEDEGLLSQENIDGNGSLKPTYFGRCYCCLESDFLPEDPRLQPAGGKRKKQRTRPKAEKTYTQSSWSSRREAFLKQPSMSHFGKVCSNNNPEFPRHKLCEKCSTMCSSSELMKMEKIENGRLYWEVFEHWETPKDMENSVKTVHCHLCTIIWSTLSDSQKEELLRIDSQLAAELEEDESNDEQRAEELRDFYAAKRGIRIVIERWVMFSRTSMVDWETYQNSGVLHHEKNQRPLKIIPHFGGTRIAKRWLNQRTASRAISLGYDPAEEWQREQAESIIISLPNINDFINDSLPGPVHLPISASTGSDETMSYIKTWLDAHEHCHGSLPLSEEQASTRSSLDHTDLNTEAMPLLQTLRKSESVILPTRLIDVGGPDSDKAQLRTSSKEELLFGAVKPDESDNTKYLALSHCWGKSHFLVLTLENRKEIMTNGVEISALARTFQDAISVTRRLGFRYLWIDSLCIIQNSEEDWMTEASSMKDVYSNASCVIAALASWDSSESFFVEQNPLAMSPCLVAVAGGSLNTYRGIYALPFSKYMAGAWRNDVSYSRLRSRAWCLQEEYLGKRVLYFGEHQIFFACKAQSSAVKQSRTSQVGQYPWNLNDGLVHQENRMLKVKKGLVQLLLKPRLGDIRDYIDIFGRWWIYRVEMSYLRRTNWLAKEEPSSGSMLENRWWEIVAVYSSRFLTKNIDRLNALAGIAAHFQSSDADAIYLAGLWGGQYLNMGLLWYVESGRQKEMLLEQGKPQDPIYAPSWSWGSVAGRIANNSLDGSPLASGITCTVEGITQSPKTVSLDVSKARLAVHGSLKSARWSYCDPGKQLYYRGHRRNYGETISESDLHASFPLTPNAKQGPAVLRLLDKAGKRIGWIVPDRADELPDQIVCLRIVVEPESTGLKEDFGIPWVTRGLVLMQVSKESRSVVGSQDDSDIIYRRLGYFELDRKPGGLTWPDVFSGPLSIRGPLLPIRRPSPDIDMHGFFDRCSDQQIYII